MRPCLHSHSSTAKVCMQKWPSFERENVKSALCQNYIILAKLSTNIPATLLGVWEDHYLRLVCQGVEYQAPITLGCPHKGAPDGAKYYLLCQVSAHKFFDWRCTPAHVQITSHKMAGVCSIDFELWPIGKESEPPHHFNWMLKPCNFLIIILARALCDTKGAGQPTIGRIWVPQCDKGLSKLDYIYLQR